MPIGGLAGKDVVPIVVSDANVSNFVSAKRAIADIERLSTLVCCGFTYSHVSCRLIRQLGEQIEVWYQKAIAEEIHET